MASEEPSALESKEIAPVVADPTYVSRCCSKNGGAISKALVRFLVTALFTASLMAFSMFKLSTPETMSEERALYYSLLASVVALYVPAPTPHDRPHLNQTE